MFNFKLNVCKTMKTLLMVKWIVNVRRCKEISQKKRFHKFYETIKMELQVPQKLFFFLLKVVFR